MKKISQEYVEKVLQENGGWKLIGEYLGVNAPLYIERDGYKVKTSFISFRQGQMCGIFSLKNPFHKENIEKRIKEINDKVEFVDARSIRRSGKVRMIIDMIDENGHKFSREIWHIMNDNVDLCCKKCARDLQTNRHRNKMYEKWLSNIDKEKFIILDYPEYITSETRIDLEEIETGYRYNANIRSIDTMQPFYPTANMKYYLYNLCKYGENNGIPSIPIEVDEEDIKKYFVKFRCVCGEEFSRNVYKWMDGKYLCPKCSNLDSNNERLLDEFLTYNNIESIREFRFNSCRDYKPLPFDFYLKDYKCLIEIDGEQHYRPIAFDGNFENADKRFALQQKHDFIKTEFCKNNNIPFLRLSYMDFESDKWKEKTLNFIKSLSSNET